MVNYTDFSTSFEGIECTTLAFNEREISISDALAILELEKEVSQKIGESLRLLPDNKSRRRVLNNVFDIFKK